MPNSDLRIERYKNSEPEIRSLYDSPESGALMYEVFSQHELNENQYPVYGNTIGDVILGFYPKSQLPKLLETNMGISSETALQITHQLSEFLTPVPDLPESNAPEKVMVGSTLPKAAGTTPQDRLELWPDGTPKSVAPDRVGSTDTDPAHQQPTDEKKGTADSPQPLTREELMSSLAPQRTMQGDIAAAKGEVVPRKDTVVGASE